MHISSVIKISFCRISFSGHQNKFRACLDSIYGSRVILVMCKNCSDISWHRLNSNQSKTNCPKNLNSDGFIVREMGPWPECIFRSLLQYLVSLILDSSVGLSAGIQFAGDSVPKTESRIQQRKTTCLLPIRILLACATALKLTTICMYACMHVCMHLCICMHAYTCMHLCICMHVCIHKCMHV